MALGAYVLPWYATRMKRSELLLVLSSALVGAWKANRGSAATITLSLTQDGHYTWQYAQKDKRQEFSGTYLVTDNLLILHEGTRTMMVGQVTLLDGNRFNFRLPGDNPNDPGVTFSK